MRTRLLSSFVQLATPIVALNVAAPSAPAQQSPLQARARQSVEGPAELTIAPSQRLEGQKLVLTGPADHRGFAVIGSATPARQLGLGVRVEVTPDVLIPFTLDADGGASIPLGQRQLRNRRVQAIVMNDRGDFVTTLFAPLELGAARSRSSAPGAPGTPETQSSTQASTPSGAVSASGADARADFGGTTELSCSSYCPECDDDPDGSYVDSNCDGIDGDVLRALFVDAEAPVAGDGSMGAPMIDLQYAIDMAYLTPGIDHVYISTGIYQGPINLANGISIYGGYDAADGWSRAVDHLVYIHNFDVFESPEGVSALRGEDLTEPMVVADLRAEAWGGGFSVTGDGDHAFGIHLYRVSGLRLERVEGAGAFADWGVDGTSMGNLSGIKLGGSGGSGGTSGSPLGSLGSSGNGTSCSVGGFGGLGGAPYIPGGDGAPGTPGLPGAWGSASFGNISISGPYLNAGGNGTDGSDGCRGGGGGGGGGGGYALFVGNGGKGGKGGNGGYAGEGGDGGQRGGSSVGLFLSASSIVAVDCLFSGDLGGPGGIPGASGSGSGGDSGSNGQSISGPNGGDGGTGGPGGIGGFAGPGAGGHCYGVLAASDSSASLSGTTLQATAPAIGIPSFVLGHGGEAVPFKQL